MTDAAIAITDLGHAYISGTWVFRHYTVDVERSSIFAILGPNGRGKTTLLKALLGVLKPSEGSVTINGSSAFVPQLFHVTFDYTVLEMVVMGRSRRIGLFSQPSSVDRAAALSALDRLGMADFALRPFHALSGGERQLVVLARAIAAEAKVLILDEPTSALDLKNQGLVLSWISRLAREDGLTIVFTTHHPHHALAVADDVLLMGTDGYECGRAADVLDEVRLSALYGIPLKRITYEFDGKTIETLAPVFSL